MNEQRLVQVIEEVIREFKANKSSSVTAPGSEPLYTGGGSTNGIFNDIDSAIKAARSAFENYKKIPLEKKHKIIEAIRVQSRRYARELAQEAHSETGFGNVECKYNKNILVADKTPGPEILEPTAYSGDHGLTVVERASYGVIGSITPSTNPTATIINNAISMLSGGNTVVFNVHPRAKRVSVKTISLLNQTITSAGGPNNLITCVAEPTIESAQYLMQSDGIDLLLVTGGPGVVNAAMSSGKRAICAGPGNPPVVVDETAESGKAGRDIINGASFDNNLPCTCEKEVFVVRQAADSLKKAMLQAGAYELSGEQIGRLENLIFKEKGTEWGHALMQPELIGQRASLILSKLGIQAGNDISMIIFETSAGHPLVWTEQMMPVLPIVRVQNFDEALELSIKAEQGFLHSACIHSMHLPHLSRMAKEMNTSMFVKNGPSYSALGFLSEGYTSFSIGTFTREGLTSARSFTWERRCVLVDHIRIV